MAAKTNNGKSAAGLSNGERPVASAPTDNSGKMYHIGLGKDDVGDIALLPGDPDRVPKIAGFFDSSEELNMHREYCSCGGYIGKRYVVAISTGIGAPSAAIAIEELARLGVTTMIRIGTCGSISRDADVGSLIVADSAVRLEGTSAQYIMREYPAAATPEVTIALKESALKLKRNVTVGATASSDSFYVGQGRSGFRGYVPSGSATLIKTLQDANVKCFEMEASALFTLGRIYGIKTGAVFAVIANRVTNGFRMGAGIEDAIKVAVDAIRSRVL
jgi:uridine phosphorylase